jgi:ribonuclease P protein component
VLDRRYRLTTSAGFTTATRRGRRVGTRTLVLHVHPCDREPGGTTTSPQVGFVVGKAIGNAVHRNRVRRRLRHLVRERLGALTGVGTVVVRALPASASATYGGLGQDLDAALRRLGLGGTVESR